ncbi:MAG: hypothetical protein Q8M02_13205 [Candidatus Didemnitutus sp.]|nr:hypothetical protein [Candidatus Didemnitutus sp.]
MESAANKQKVTYRLYSVDERALNEITSALNKAVPAAALDRSDVMRGLVHLTPEIELEALGILRSRYERRGGALPADDACDLPLTLRLPDADKQKLKDVTARIKRRGVPSGEAELVRALAHLQRHWPDFAPELIDYLNDFPDGRALRWKSARK